MPVISGGSVIGLARDAWEELLITESDGAGTYTASVTVPAGAYLNDVRLQGVALWTASSSATAIVGDAADDNGIFDSVDLKATDLLAAETISASGGRNTAGGKHGADLTSDTWNRRYLSTERVITAMVTTVGASGSAGRTRLLVGYTTTIPTSNASKA